MSAEAAVKLPVLPATRADCADEVRPCIHVRCRHHLYLDVTEAGSLKLNFPGMDVDEIPMTCSLDMAEDGGATLEQVASVLGVTKERARQIEEKALRRLRTNRRLRELNR